MLKGKAQTYKLCGLMVDTLSRVARSRLMAQIKSKGTTPEVVVRRILHRAGYRYRLHYKSLPGSPDIVFPARRKVIFVHGCFWHAHFCQKGRVPKSNRSYWKSKLEKNVLRSNKAKAKLRNLGWKVIIVWECKTKAPDKILQRLIEFLGPSTQH
jgi:DNA mismatch endonuclease (patch repair protein)